MTLVGDKAAFAIDYEVADEQPDPFGGLGPLVRLSYWIGGKRVGNADLPTYANDLEGSLRHHLADRGHRRNYALYARPAPELIAFLQGWRDDPTLAGRAAEERWSAYDIERPLDRAEYRDDLQTAWAVHLIEDAENARVIAYPRTRPTDVIEGWSKAGQADAVLASTWDAMKALLGR